MKIDPVKLARAGIPFAYISKDSVVIRTKDYERARAVGALIYEPSIGSVIKPIQEIERSAVDRMDAEKFFARLPLVLISAESLSSTPASSCLLMVSQVANRHSVDPLGSVTPLPATTN